MQTTVALTVTSNNIPRFFEKEKKIPDTFIGFIWKYCNQFFITLSSIYITLQQITSRKVKLRVIWWLQNSLDSNNALLIITMFYSIKKVLGENVHTLTNIFSPISKKNNNFVRTATDVTESQFDQFKSICP